MGAPQGSHWCITINNPDHAYDYYIDTLTPKVKYGVFQRERGDSGV